jgi:hypothetical protein
MSRFLRAHSSSLFFALSMTRCASIAISAAILAGVTLPAMAQEAIVEGPGYEIREGTVLHPSVGVETGVVSNVFYEEDGGRTAPVIRVRAGFSIASEHNRPATEVDQLVVSGEDEDEDGSGRAAPALDFRLSGYLAREQYLHPADTVSAQSDFYGGLRLHLETMPQGTLSFVLDDHVVRVISPQGFESGRTLNRVINHLRAGVRLRPGNGALALQGRYENTIDHFESGESAFASRLQHLLRAQAAWQYLPVTRFFFDASLGFFGPLQEAHPELSRRRSMPLRLRLGAASAITELTTVRAHAGFGKGFYEAGEDFTMALFGAELGLRYSPVGRVTVSYEYDFHDSVVGNFFRDHALTARVDQQIDLVLLKAGLDLRLRGYRGIREIFGAPSRDDVIVRAFAKGHYLYRDWLAFTAELDLTGDWTDYMANVVEAGTARVIGTDNPSYQRVLFQVGTVAAF